jgi:hypothetical protein
MLYLLRHTDACACEDCLAAVTAAYRPRVEREAHAAEWRRRLSIAQHAGDDAYELVRKAGGTPEAMADAYQAAFQAESARQGVGL